jgi:hypothetical protein
VYTADYRFGLRSPDGAIVEWRDIAPERLREALGSHQAVCWTCQISEIFRQRYPELVVDR